MKLRDLRRIHVEEWLARIPATKRERGEGRFAPTTIAGARRTLSLLLSDAAGQAPHPLIAGNPAAGRLRNMPRVTVEKVFPSPEAAAAILQQLQDHELYPMFLLFRWSGARTGEIRGLRPGDLHLQRGTITFAKQSGDAPLKTDGSRRDLPMPDPVLEAIAGFPRRSLSHVFTTRTGREVDHTWIGRTLRDACKRAGVPHYTPHAFRHAFAAELLGARLPDSYVMRLLGHTSIVTTVHEYGHLRAVRGATVTELSRWWSRPEDAGHEAFAR